MNCVWCNEPHGEPPVVTFLYPHYGWKNVRLHDPCFNRLYAWLHKS